MTQRNPKWWTNENDSSWDRVKAAFKRDWDQTQHDAGAGKPDTKQNVKDTVKQATGKEAIPPRGQAVYEKAELAYRFGYAARSNYGKTYPQWNADLEEQLRRDWEEMHPGSDSDWNGQTRYVRTAWDYKN